MLVPCGTGMRMSTEVPLCPKIAISDSSAVLAGAVTVFAMVAAGLKLITAEAPEPPEVLADSNTTSWSMSTARPSAAPLNPSPSVGVTVS